MKVEGCSPPGASLGHWPPLSSFILLLSSFSPPRHVPRDADDDHPLVASEEQQLPQDVGPVIVEQNLPPAILDEIRNDHRHETIALALDLLDIVEQRREEPPIRTGDRHEAGAAAGGP